MIDFCVCLLCTLAHIPSIILRYIPFKNKISKNQRMVLSIIYAIAILLNFIMCYILKLQGNFTIGFFKTNLTLFCMFMALINIIVVRGFIKEHLFAFGLTAIIVLILYSISAFIAYITINDDLNMQFVICNACLLALFIVTYYFISRLMKKTITPFLEIKDKSYWNTVWFIPISMFFASILATPMNSHITTFAQLVGRMLVGSATLFICFSVSKDYKRVIEREHLNEQISLQKQYYAALTEKVNLEREQRHNFKHHMAALRGFIDADDKEGLVKYYEKYETGQPQNIQIPYSGNAAVDGVLFHYASLASLDNINFETCCILQDVNISDIDLCNLLGNALDNAITACKMYDGKRYISVAMKKDNSVLYITIDNSFNGILDVKDGKYFSLKRDHEEGIGIKSMKKICDNYNGYCRFNKENNKFEASFLLKL